MTKLEKCVVGMGAGISTLTVFAIGILALHFPGSSISPNTAVKTATGSNPARYQARDFGKITAVQSNPGSPAAQTVINPLPADATFVPDGSLQQLSLMVNLAGAKNEQPDKDRWTQAVGVAEKLITGPCDCAQRVWLRNFIEMGNDAITGSAGQYHEIAKLMLTLERNNKQQAIVLSHKPDVNR